MSTLHHSRKGYITCNAYSTEQRVFLCLDLSRTAWKVSPVSASLWRCCGASESLFSSSSILRSAEPELADVLEVVLRQCATLSEDELPAPQNVSKVPDVLRHHTWRNVRYLTFYVTMPDVFRQSPDANATRHSRRHDNVIAPLDTFAFKRNRE